ncbi:Protein N-acetyltransferase, RimJ/RimL family [Nonlabens sp. Hel1_33_55]|uniref:GNAT family N-acetyltransferase n=1 Tax=Nonlabens sp. Hel1_33_55 TaxID=1336802 RepID=UPI000875CAF7|nr:GNAT family N-acetyltransferase [Nonlabens sp. Hel1_33_55]SCY35194.1 Protein N-acetyltransferase, RimJ/RimL family [Nonlabens sp. Hel1_33_55]
MKYLIQNLETERLRFRLLQHSDFKAWLPFFDLTASYSHLFLDASKSKEDLCEFWIDKTLTRYQENRGGLCVLENKDSGGFIGMCGLLVQEIDGDTRLEVGYSLLPNYWGKGFAIEAAAAAKNYGFQNSYDLDFGCSVVSMIHIDNHPSIKVAIKNEMLLEKTFIAEKSESFHVYSQQRENWENNHK